MDSMTKLFIHVREGAVRRARGQALVEYVLVVGLIATILGTLIAFLALGMSDGSN